MPLREYQCDACGHRFEVIQKMSDPPLDKCPKCGGVLRKLQAAPAFHLKGTGWYVTDYGKKDQSSAKAEDESKGNTAKGSADKDRGGQDKGDKDRGDQGESKTDTTKSESKTDSAKSSDSSAAAASGASSTPSSTPAKTPAKDS